MAAQNCWVKAGGAFTGELRCVNRPPPARGWALPSGDTCAADGPGACGLAWAAGLRRGSTVSGPPFGCRASGAIAVGACPPRSFALQLGVPALGFLRGPGAPLPAARRCWLTWA